MYLTREELEELNEAGRHGAALYEAVNKGIITNDQADAIVSRPRLETDEVNGAAVVPFPIKKMKDSTI